MISELLGSLIVLFGSQLCFQCESTDKADIILLVEVYESTGLEDYRNIKSFITKIVSIFDIGPDKVQIGLYQYNSDLTIDWHLNTHLTKQSLLKAVDNLQQRESCSTLGRTLNFVLNYNFIPEFGMRAESQKIGILITDTDAKDISGFQDSQFPRDTSIEVYTIGVKNVNETQLRAIASDPHEIHMYSVSDLSFLLDIVDNLTINLCNSALVPVRLVSGTSLCSGRLEVKSEQSWFSVCEADFDQQDAQVACRELGCGPPSVLQGLLYEEVIEAPMWTKELRCGGHESSLLHCGRSDSVRSTCSSGKAVGLTCLVHVRLVGGARRCAGTLEVKQGEWRPVSASFSILKDATVACTALDCGSAVSVGNRKELSDRSVWIISSECAHSGSALWDCATSSLSSSIVELTCSESVRLVSGTSLCSGRLEVKSEQSWFSVCEADFDQQDAEVVCRELGCGAPSVLQGPLYVEVKGPMWAKEFQCGGHESSLLDCGRSDSARRTCSPGKAVGLTCSEPFRLVGRASRCADPVRLVNGTSLCSGRLEVKSEQSWFSVCEADFDQQDAKVVCRELGCGTPSVLQGVLYEEVEAPMWTKEFQCRGHESSLLNCGRSDSARSTCSSGKAVGLTCSEPVRLVGGASSCAESVRLVSGTSLCSGRLEVKSEQSWFSVCEADFDQWDAEVVCRELNCGTPSVLQGVLYEEAEAPMWTKEFQCRGHESSLLDCGISDSARRTCSPSKAVRLTCSEPVRLMGGASRCAGTLEVKQVVWRPVSSDQWTLKEATLACRALDCGSAVSTGSRNNTSGRYIWLIEPECVQSGSALRDCATLAFASSIMELTCSDLLVQPIISLSSTMGGVSDAKQQGFWVHQGSNFTISCSIQPQYPGGSFQLTFTSSDTTHNYTQPAVNHFADFLFTAADPTHQGNYSCIYNIYVFSHNFSSESRVLFLTVQDPTDHIIRLVVLLVTLPLVTAIFFIFKANRGQKSGPQENIELDSYNLGVPRAAGEPVEEERAQGAELDPQGATQTH
eukprot:superscaffoldBa00000586_g5832